MLLRMLLRMLVACLVLIIRRLNWEDREDPYSQGGVVGILCSDIILERQTGTVFE